MHCDWRSLLNWCQNPELGQVLCVSTRWWCAQCIYELLTVASELTWLDQLPRGRGSTCRIAGKREKRPVWMRIGHDLSGLGRFGDGARQPAQSRVAMFQKAAVQRYQWNRICRGTAMEHTPLVQPRRWGPWSL